MPAPAASRPRHGGIRKHQQQRRDRDGDVSMGTAPRTAPVRPAQRKDNNSGPRASSTPSFVELKVTGWTDEKEMTKLISFLERHSSRRSTKASRGPVPPKMIKRHRVVGQVLTISVRQEDVTPFGKINGFTFASTHGNQKLNISGPGIRSKSPPTTTADGQDQSMGGAEGSNAKDKPNTVELLKGFLQRRYDPNSKLLNFSSIASDEEVLKSGMFDTLSTQKKFFPALMVVCGQLLKTAEEKKAAVESVTLSNNNLPNLDVVRDLSVELPHIINLDISGNKFETLSVLKPWKNRFRHLEQLIVDPFTTSGWEEELTAWFPKLQKLNGIVVRAEQAPAAAAATVAPIPPVTTEPAAAGSALTPQQEEMVVYVQRETKLKREMAIQCLVAAEWNLEKAAELFKTANLTPDAFE